ncbi:RHS repeat-associated core domain-containing protein [Delftia acidovorans]|nr:RHS repeat-associated core domain-containing protein [Delftia acidovorans]MCG3782975.1 RHS repeat-associated core domain-containing protein [Delftia acidovorans]
MPGQHHDREMGLYYNRHRYCDPVVESYVDQDPIGWNGGTNHYDYSADPLSWIDSLGLRGQEGVGAAANAANKARKSANFGKDMADA